MLATIPCCSVLCLYRNPDSEIAAILSQWLEEHEERYIIVFEKNANAFLQPVFHEKVRLCPVNQEEAMQALAWEFVFLDFDYFLDPKNNAIDHQEAQSIFKKMSTICEKIHLEASSYRERGLDGLKNIFKNWPLLTKARQGMDLSGKFAGIPAIICGAGLSLEKEIGELKNIQDRALIFAGGTTLCSLSKFNIMPYFAAAIDPHPMLKRFENHRAKHIPMFFQGKAQPLQLQQMKGELLWIPSNCTDPAEKWLSSQLKKTEEAIETGWNVSIFLTVIAHILGCDPIIFVGMDFVQEKDKSYAGAVEREEQGTLIPVPDKEGLWTRRDWLQAAGWLSSWIKEHPETRWINTSFQGLEIEGTEKKALKDLSFSPQQDLQKMVEMHVKNAPKLVENAQEFLAKKNTLIQSFTRARILCEKMLLLLEKIFPLPPEENGECALLELEIEKEIVYSEFLVPVWEVWKPVFARKVPQNIPEAYALGLNRWLFMKGICDETRSL